MIQLPDRFLTKVNVTDGCWIWIAALTQEGYGTYWWDGKTRPAHRYSWSFFNGDIPQGMVICHNCDVPSCVNPDHLFLGTIQDNHADMVEKRRNVSGEKSGLSKLTEIQVIEMRNKYKNDNCSLRDLSKHYGITRENVWCIVKNKTWKKVKTIV